MVMVGGGLVIFGGFRKNNICCGMDIFVALFLAITSEVDYLFGSLLK